MMIREIDKTFLPDRDFAEPATDEQIERTAQALEANGIHVLIAENAANAKKLFFDLVPDGSEIFLGASVTLEKLGIKDEVDKSGHFDALRPRMFAMDRQTQGREIRKLGASPEVAAGSVQAITEQGQVMLASKTGSQLGPYASGAGKVIWVAGAQKIVTDLDEGFRRIQTYSYPLEQEHSQNLYHFDSSVNKILIVNREFRPGRITMIIVKEVVGF